MPIPSGGPIWQNDLNWSRTSPARSKTTPGKVTARQPGLHREVTRAQHSSVKSQCGGPPTASILRTRDLPEEEASWIQPPPCGNSDSTGRSPVPPIPLATTGLTNDRPHTPHLDVRTTTSARTNHPVGVRTGRPHPADNPRRAATQAAVVHPNAVMSRSHCSRLPNRGLSGSWAGRKRRPRGACPPCGSGRAAQPRNRLPSRSIRADKIRRGSMKQS
jgi:hypothetical protein